MPHQRRTYEQHKKDHLYVISNEQFRRDNVYKYGLHGGDRKKLNRRYMTSMGRVDIIYFRKSVFSAYAEKEVKKHMTLHRVYKNKGEGTELIRCDINKLRTFIDNLINDMEAFAYNMIDEACPMCVDGDSTSSSR